MKPIPRYSTCFVCGSENKFGLSIQFQFDEQKGEIVAEFLPEDWWCGYKGIVHGGILASILDEGMGWTIFPRTGEYYLTIELNVRYKQPLVAGVKYLLKARFIGEKGKIFFAEGEIYDEKGAVYAKGKGSYKRKPQET